MRVGNILLRAGVGLALALGLAGCSLPNLGSGPPPDLYVLSPKSTFPDDLPTVSWQLVVEEPSTAKGIDTDRIAIAPSALEVKYFGGSRWADRAPRMVQQLLIQSFENTKKIVSVGRQSIGLRSDFVLKTELREFQAEKTAEGKTIVRVRVNLKLVRPSLGQIVASESFESVKDSASEGVPDIVQAFDEGVGAVLKRAVAWTLRAGDENLKKTPKDR
ncbi:MAG: membrane integrity-associated transporter subunit PqiC [Alphaproteobacteria bacterium]|nr:membrane integrity-associated transporter subunit PqiC [Alphaproteobacteria bacterium]